MRVPSFSIMGGKAKLRSKLIPHFPHSGRRYIEPFYGGGNVFFLAKQELNYRAWILNDRYSKLMSGIKMVDVDYLPEIVDKALFLELKSRFKLGDALATVLEPRITFGGKGYNSGFAGNRKTGSKSDSDYSQKNYRKTLIRAKELLEGRVFLYNWDWWEFIQSIPNLNEQDFMFIDPPYFGTKAHYPNIDHELLCSTLSSLSDKGIRWALSGYDNELYQEKLQFKSRYEFIRNSELKQSSTRRKEPVIEVLWTSY